MTIIIYAIVGAIAGAFGFLFSKITKANSKTENTISGIFVGIGIVACNLIIMPAYNEWKSLKVLENIPLYKTIKEVDPEEYKSISAELKKAVKEKKNSEYILTKVRPVITKLIKKHSPYASDQSLINYMKINIEEIRQVGGKTADGCYQMLFPEIYGSIQISNFVDKKIAEQDLEALNEVLKSAKTRQKQTAIDSADLEKNYEKIMKELLPKFGKDLVILENLNAKDVDKKKGCEISIAIMESMLNLPTKDAAGMIRNLFAESGQ